MTQTHIIGGVRMIVQDGEIYCLLHDILDQADNDKRIQDTFKEELPLPATHPKKEAKAKPIKGKKKCSNCGEYGHQARTCAFSPSTSPNTKQSLKELVQEAIDAGQGYEEICMNNPGLPSAAINKTYKELTTATK